MGFWVLGFWVLGFRFVPLSFAFLHPRVQADQVHFGFQLHSLGEPKGVGPRLNTEINTRNFESRLDGKVHHSKSDDKKLKNATYEIANDHKVK